jgi:hypothetical protein
MSSKKDSEERWIECEQVYSSNRPNDSSDDGVSLETNIFFEPDIDQSFYFSLIPSDDGGFIFQRHSSSASMSDLDCQDHQIIEISGIKAEYGQIINSTGCTLWRASTLLCNFLCAHYKSYVVNKSIVELGAGLGLVGITSYMMGGAKRIVMTDGDTDALERQRQNVQTNIVSHAEEDWDTLLPCRQLRWGHSQQIQDFKRCWGTFDVVLGSDIIYLEEILDPLFETVVELLSLSSKPEDSPFKQDEFEIQSQQPVFLLAYARRNVKIDLVLETASRHGLEYLSRPEIDDEGIYIFSRKHHYS